MSQPLSPLARVGQQHARDLINSLGRLYRTPVASLLTAAVIGITLALPIGLRVLVNSLERVSYGWQGNVTASLFLTDNTTQDAGRALAAQIAERPGVAAVAYISSAQALAEFRKLSGFGAALDALAANPLPAVIAVTPAPDLDASTAARLMTELAALPEVGRAQMDQQWLQRLYAAVAVVRTTVLIIAVLLAGAVLFIVGNTIRLDIENRREEIAVMKLLGATDGFVRRPFLYSGFWYGLTGGVLAWLLLTASLLLLSGPVNRLAGLYGAHSSLLWLGWKNSLLLLGCGIGLGWLGSAATVGRRLRAIQPR
ncbi:MAG: permease-like cell division protein FtsX [Salinisphaera sp.]|nr:permease-like cell division protein FtsX [Salinisphaera sp.]